MLPLFIQFRRMYGNLFSAKPVPTPNNINYCSENTGRKPTGKNASLKYLPTESDNQHVILRFRPVHRNQPAVILPELPEPEQLPKLYESRTGSHLRRACPVCRPTEPFQHPSQLLSNDSSRAHLTWPLLFYDSFIDCV